MNNIVDWYFPQRVFPIPEDKRIEYHLVAKIFSATSTGHHFTTTVRTTQNQVYTVDGMQIHTDPRIRDLLKAADLVQEEKDKLHLRGQAYRMNQHSTTDLTALVGQHPLTVAAFYILEAPGYAKDLFLDIQRAEL